MKVYVALSLVIFYVSFASCRPQSVQIERQNLLHVQRSIMKEEYPRGSTEETRKILQQIERINMALGYKRRQSVAFPRVASNEGYFYPRQQFRPEFLTRPRENNLRMNNRRAIYPFNNQNYYYPAPYLQTPSDEGAQAFNPNFYPLVYMPLNGLSGLRYEYNTIGDEKERSIKLGTIVVLPAEDRASKALETPKKVEKKAGKNKGKPEESESSIIDDFVNIVPDALGFSDEDEDDRQEPIVSSTLLPSIKNDKFLNLALKKHPQEEYDEERQLVPTPVKNNVNRAFNFSSNFQKPIEKLQNFTKQFSFNQSQAKEVDMEVNPSTPSAEDIEDAEDDKADDKEDAKSPFGFAFGPTQQLETYKKGGLIIQRLKVRRGGIAIAGPGGVATAGSGGTAIVGPNGIAFTHPRGLAIGGPGAKIYALPEDTDLERLAVTHQARSLNLEQFLVAKGPVVYYNEN